MIPFNVPPFIGTELEYVKQAIDAHKICGDGQFTKKCHAFLEERFGAQKVLLTTSGTTALEMATLLCGLGKGDEVIVPSFTFSSTATAIVLTGATAVHYAGVACEMDTIMDIAARHNLKVIEDAAQGVMSTYKGRALGTIGDFGCYSFHETKNYSMGEGGALLIRDPRYNDAAEILREKGTNRARFFRGQVDKYTWVDYGSSYLPSDMNAAYLWAQLQEADRINDNRLAAWNTYSRAFAPLAASGRIEVPTIPEGCVHNAHMYYIKLRGLDDRTDFIRYMKDKGIVTVFHYIPLHSAPAGLKFGRFHGEDRYTTSEGDRLVRLPLYYGLTAEDQDYVIRTALEYLNKE